MSITQTSIFDMYTGSMRKERQRKVKQVLTNDPKTRDDNKRLLIEVWRLELREHGIEIPIDVLLAMRHFCSAPSSIDRDRRRVDILEAFPRKDDKFDKYLEYKHEMSDHSRKKKWSDSYD